jgi:hypothetical protein
LLQEPLEENALRLLCHDGARLQQAPPVTTKMKSLGY